MLYGLDVIEQNRSGDSETMTFIGGLQVATQLADACRSALTAGSESIPIKMPGRWGKSDKRQLYPGGPIGQIVQEYEGGNSVKYNRGIVVMFDAKELLDFITKQTAVICTDIGCSGVDPALCPGNTNCEIIKKLARYEP